MRTGIYAVCANADAVGNVEMPLPVATASGKITVGPARPTTAPAGAPTSISISAKATTPRGTSIPIRISGYDNVATCTTSCSVNVHVLPAGERCAAKAAGAFA